VNCLLCGRTTTAPGGICPRCRETSGHWAQCWLCGQYIDRQGDARNCTERSIDCRQSNWFCVTCYERHRMQHVIRPYNWRPVDGRYEFLPEFKPTGLYYGVEVEMEAIIPTGRQPEDVPLFNRASSSRPVHWTDRGPINPPYPEDEDDSDPDDLEHIEAIEEPQLLHDRDPEQRPSTLRPMPALPGQDEVKRRAAGVLVDASDHGRLYHIKHDGSLQCGFELVTSPATLAYHVSEFPWNEAMRLARESGMEARQTCGLHIHVSKAGLPIGTRPADRSERRGRRVQSRKGLELFQSKLQMLAAGVWPHLFRASRRERWQLESYARPPVGTSMRYGVETFFNMGRTGHYDAINAVHRHNPGTIEFRLWGGTMDRQEIIAALRLTEALCMVAAQSSISQLSARAVAWPQVVEYATQRGQAGYEETRHYLKSIGMGG
jgi:hypothetical protein